MGELKPCPFCGGNDIQIDEMESFWDKNETSWRVLCIDCIGETAGDTKEQAISAWNRRSQPENKPLTLEELQEMFGEPVWISYDGEINLVELFRERHGYIWFWYFGNEADTGFLTEHYGKTWLAYRYKPKEVQG